MQYWVELSCSSKFNPLIFFSLQSLCSILPRHGVILFLACAFPWKPTFRKSLHADTCVLSAGRRSSDFASFRYPVTKVSIKYGSFFLCLSPPHPPPLWMKTQQQPGKWQRQFSSLAKDMNHERFPRQPWAVKEWKQSGCWDLPSHSIKAAGRY